MECDIMTPILDPHLAFCLTRKHFSATPSFLRRIHIGKLATSLKKLNDRITEHMRCGLIGEAQKLFEGSPSRNTVTWNSMVRGCFLNGEPDRALHLFNKMPERDVYSYNTVIAGLMQLEDFVGARKVFDTMPDRDIVSWNSMIAGYTRNHLMHEAMTLFREMPERNVVSWNLVMSGLVKLGSLDHAKELFDEMPERDMASWTLMISGLAGSGCIDQARQLFDKMPERDAHAWNTMLIGYIQNERVDSSKVLFMKMPARDLTSWRELIRSLVNEQQVNDALKLFMEMPERSSYTFNLVLLGLIRNGLLKEVHAFFEKNPFKDIVSWTSMVVGYFEAGDVDSACALFRAMPCWDVTSWNATIFGLGQNGCNEEGLMLYVEMRWKDFNPDQATFTSILNICSILSSLKFGFQAHGQIIKLGYIDFVAVGNAVITMYSRCGSSHDALMAFSCMTSHDTISWNSIICGFSYHGKGREALELFRRMRSTHVKPDPVTFVGVLSACSHAGLVKEGQYYFHFMEFKCFIKPTDKHYTCIVDLLGRHGFIDDALRFVERMGGDGLQVSGSVWGALLGACRTYGRLDVGENAGKRVVENEAWNAGAYLILVEIYIAGGRSADAESVLALMKERGIKKEPGCSWIDVKNRVHVFLAGDGSHPEINEVYNMVALLEGMQSVIGYGPASAGGKFIFENNIKNTTPNFFSNLILTF